MSKLDDASTEYLLSLLKEHETAKDQGAVINLDDPVVKALLAELSKRTQYLDEVGLEYLIMRLRYIFGASMPKQFEYKVVTTLPTTGEAATIYLVRLTANTTSQNLYSEYIWVDGKYELLGQIDASGGTGPWMSTTEVENLIASKLNGYIKKISLNGSSYTANSDGSVTLGNLCANIYFNGSYRYPDSVGTINLGSVDISSALSGYVKSIKLNGSTYTPTNGVVDLGTIQSGSTGNCALAIALNTQINTNNRLHLGNGAVVSANDSTAIGVNAQATKQYCVSIGYNSKAAGINTVAIGTGSNCDSGTGVAIGTDVKTTSGLIAMGLRSSAAGAQSISMGYECDAAGMHGVSIGFRCSASSVYSVAIGSNATGAINEGMAIGCCSYGGNHCIAIGTQVSVREYNSVGIGYGAIVSTNNTFRLGGNNITTLNCKVALTTSSDERDKIYIDDIRTATKFLQHLDTFRYRSNARDEYLVEETDEEHEIRSRFGAGHYDKEAHARGDKMGDRIRVGVSAQGVLEALYTVYGDENYANLVMDPFYGRDDVPPDLESRLGVTYENFIPFLIKAIQELDDRITTLETRRNNS